jgi:hypothetical protein
VPIPDGFQLGGALFMVAVLFSWVNEYSFGSIRAIFLLLGHTLPCRALPVLV